MPIHAYDIHVMLIKLNQLQKYKLKVIYDAAHAFGIKYRQRSVLDYGDMSVLVS